MAVNKRLVAFGCGGAVLAVEIMQPSAYFTVPLLFLSLFLIAWGIVPDQLRRLANNTGALAPHLKRGLDGFDNFFISILAKAGDAGESLDRLSRKMEDGLTILNCPVSTDEEFALWQEAEEKWTDDVFSEIEKEFNRASAVTFQSVGSVTEANFPPFFNPPHNVKKLKLNKKIENLRRFLDRH